MKSYIKILNKFVSDYDFETIQDLKDTLTKEDIMENIISLGEGLSECDTTDCDEAIKIIDRLSEWKILYEFISK